MDNERKAFEEYISSLKLTRLHLGKWEDLQYKNPEVMDFWKGWQARAAMSKKEDCSICQNTGTYCIGTSGLACDGNAPIFERCECEWGFPDEEVAPPPPAALKATDIVLTSLDFHISGPTAEIVKFARRIIAQARGEK